MKTRIHVNISVRDLDASIAFYRALFGSEPTKIRSDYANFRLDTPALHLALVSKPDHVPAERDQHFGVELFDEGELGAWRQRVEAEDIPLRIEEQVTCCYAVADKFWAQDPDGNDWEFWVRSDEAEAMSEEAAADECCAPMPLTTIEGLAPAPSKPDEGAGCCA